MQQTYDASKVQIEEGVCKPGRPLPSTPALADESALRDDHYGI
ncbi:hypothetical protein ACFIOY_18470 [Bradyrhizobium sp. TZ2]